MKTIWGLLIIESTLSYILGKLQTICLGHSYENKLKIVLFLVHRKINLGFDKYHHSAYDSQKLHVMIETKISYISFWDQVYNPFPSYSASYMFLFQYLQKWLWSFLSLFGVALFCETESFCIDRVSTSLSFGITGLSYHVWLVFICYSKALST